MQLPSLAEKYQWKWRLKRKRKREDPVNCSIKIPKQNHQILCVDLHGMFQFDPPQIIKKELPQHNAKSEVSSRPKQQGKIINIYDYIVASSFYRRTYDKYTRNCRNTISVHAERERCSQAFDRVGFYQSTSLHANHNNCSKPHSMLSNSSLFRQLLCIG